MRSRSNVCTLWTKLAKLCQASIVCIVVGLLPTGALAQSSACNANEDTVTFNFSATNVTSSTGSSRTWTAGTLANAYNVATVGSVGQNTISFTVTTIGSAPLLAPDPSLLTQGNVPNSLSLNMDAVASGNGVTLTLVFNRPMDKVRFNMYDVDRNDPAPWQDRLNISGSMNGTNVPIPILVPTTAGRHTTATVAQGNEITTNTTLNCAATDASCNVQVNFANPIDRAVVAFIAGPAFGAPAAQRVALNDFSYCVPKRDLRVTKTSGTNTFVAGATTTYLLTINNRGGAATTGNRSVTDVISAQGVSFVNPQTPTGWTCAFGTTTFVADIANCFTATGIAAGGTTVLTLTVSISPAATATTAINRAKVYGGGDPNKTLATSTGPVANCDALNENFSGGGATYFGGVDTTDAGCSFESTPIVRRALLTVARNQRGNDFDGWRYHRLHHYICQFGAVGCTRHRGVRQPIGWFELYHADFHFNAFDFCDNQSDHLEYNFISSDKYLCHAHFSSKLHRHLCGGL